MLHVDYDYTGVAALKSMESLLRTQITAVQRHRHYDGLGLNSNNNIPLTASATKQKLLLILTCCLLCLSNVLAIAS